ncbi:hypothetical protein CKALI_08175 [Corynebacterium kalinowskii]|uniref:Uncharacterized protein n=1 Tax=Corynebacterium kalinowskii TaxID=2675216 RepID=A0A6B8VU71_9CORY|nr:hypothetical protein [Corynebacterium kalinowskii]QGU02495.1 hypothetical protein CKALI_08175 [Corynebacterium kalinowskii]
MWHAVSFALMDSINVLLIGVIVTIGVLLPPRAAYRRIAALLVGGDWLGVFLLSIPTLAVFDLIKDKVQAALESPVFGIILIAVGVLGAVMTFRGGDNTALVNKIMQPLQVPTWKTAATGFVLGVVQSATSVPFFAGLAYLSAGGFSVGFRYTALFLYATLALSLPFLTAVLIGFVRAFPNSPAGRGFEWARNNTEILTPIAGYGVSLILTIMGIAHLV